MVTTDNDFSRIKKIRRPRALFSRLEYLAQLRDWGRDGGTVAFPRGRGGRHGTKLPRKKKKKLSETPWQQPPPLSINGANCKFFFEMQQVITRNLCKYFAARRRLINRRRWSKTAKPSPLSLSLFLSPFFVKQKNTATLPDEWIKAASNHDRLN